MKWLRTGWRTKGETCACMLYGQFRKRLASIIAVNGGQTAHAEQCVQIRGVARNLIWVGINVNKSSGA